MADHRFTFMPPGAVGLCESCSHVQCVPSSRGSVFYRCRLSELDPRFPKYPALPVIQCAGYDRAPADPDVQF